MRGECNWVWLTEEPVAAEGREGGWVTGLYTGVNRRPDCKHTKDVMMRLLIKQAGVINSEANRKQLAQSKEQNNKVLLASSQHCRGRELNDPGLVLV